MDSINVNSNVLAGVFDDDVEGKVLVIESVIAGDVVVKSSKGSIGDNEFELFKKDSCASLLM